MPNDQKESEGSSVRAEVGQTSGDSGGNSAAVDQVFSMFKDFLEKKLEDKGKQIEQRSKLDKEVVQLKFKGNQKQFELNAELDAIFESIETESESIEPNLSQIKKLSQEGRQRIRKRQKLIKIADKSRDGWQVVAEYESDELASGSEDEKRLKKAREAASRKRRQKEQLSSDRGKKPRIALGADNQLFRDKKKSFLFTLYIHMCFGSACASYYRFTTGFITAFIFQAVETLLATSFAVSNAANLDTGPRTVDPCSGREVTSPLATILALESPTTSQPQANQLNQSNEDDLAQVDQITQNYELESGHSLSVKGNLKNNLGFWRSIGAPDFILSIIENGYRLPFISFPLAVKLRNNKSARLHADFVDQAVLELVNSGRLRMVNEQPFVVNPLSVSIQPCGKKRLIIDLRHVNKSLIKQSVKYEDWKIAVLFCERRVHAFL